MTDTKDDVLKAIREYIEANPTADIKSEIDALLPPSVEPGTSGNIATELSAALTKLQLNAVTAMPKLEKGQSFSHFCEKYLDHVYITKTQDDNLYRYFLQLMTDEMYATLKSVNLSDLEKKDAALFTARYLKVLYGDQSITLKNQLLDCIQYPDETISQYAYRLKEKASIAYTDLQQAEDNLLIAFLRGIHDETLKHKVNDNAATTFKETVRTAKNFETVDNMMNKQKSSSVVATGPTSILKETTISFNESTHSENNNPHTGQNIPQRVQYEYQPESTNSHHNNSQNMSYNRQRSRTPEYRSRSQSRTQEYRRSNSRSRTPEYRNRSRTPEYNRSRSYHPNYFTRRDRSRTPDPRRHRSRTPDRRNQRSRTPDRSRTPERRQGSSYRGVNRKLPTGWQVRQIPTCWICSRPGHVAKFCWYADNSDYTDQEN